MAVRNSSNLLVTLTHSPAVTHASVRSYPRLHLYPRPSQLPVLPAPHNVFRRHFVRFPDHAGSSGANLVVFATRVVRVDNHRIGGTVILEIRF